MVKAVCFLLACLSCLDIVVYCALTPSKPSLRSFLPLASVAYPSVSVYAVYFIVAISAYIILSLALMLSNLVSWIWIERAFPLDFALLASTDVWRDASVNYNAVILSSTFFTELVMSSCAATAVLMLASFVVSEAFTVNIDALSFLASAWFAVMSASWAFWSIATYLSVFLRPVISVVSVLTALSMVPTLWVSLSVLTDSCCTFFLLVLIWVSNFISAAFTSWI